MALTASEVIDQLIHMDQDATVGATQAGFLEYDGQVQVLLADGSTREIKYVENIYCADGKLRVSICLSE